MSACLPHVTFEGFSPHPLHGPDRCFSETNCYVDLWIEVLHALKLPPEAGLGFTAAQDFEGDHFTFSKFPLDDLELLFGLRCQELAVYETVDVHIERQMRRGRLCLVEVDPYFLPDTKGTSYRTYHGKTTIAPNRLDPEARRMEYFHNGGYAVLDGDDFEGVFPVGPDGRPMFWPYVEFTTLEPVRRPLRELKELARSLFARHETRRPAANPIRAFQAVAPGQAAALAGAAPEAFNDYAFNNLRLLGANFELYGAGLDWLTGGADPRSAHCRVIAETAKTAQFHLARAMARRRFDLFAKTLDPAAEAWERLFDAASVRHAA